MRKKEKEGKKEEKEGRTEGSGFRENFTGKQVLN